MALKVLEHVGQRKSLASGACRVVENSPVGASGDVFIEDVEESHWMSISGEEEVESERNLDGEK